MVATSESRRRHGSRVVKRLSWDGPFRALREGTRCALAGGSRSNRNQPAPWRRPSVSKPRRDYHLRSTPGTGRKLTLQPVLKFRCFAQLADTAPVGAYRWPSRRCWKTRFIDDNLAIRGRLNIPVLFRVWPTDLSEPCLFARSSPASWVGRLRHKLRRFHVVRFQSRLKT